MKLFCCCCFCFVTVVVVSCFLLLVFTIRLTPKIIFNKVNTTAIFCYWAILCEQEIYVWNRHIASKLSKQQQQLQRQKQQQSTNPYLWFPDFEVSPGTALHREDLHPLADNIAMSVLSSFAPFASDGASRFAVRPGEVEAEVATVAGLDSPHFALVAMETGAACWAFEFVSFQQGHR